MLDKMFMFRLTCFGAYFQRNIKFKNWVPGGNFLKYGENKENDIFSIDNTIVLKKNVDNFELHF